MTAITGKSQPLVFTKKTDSKVNEKIAETTFKLWLRVGNPLCNSIILITIYFEPFPITPPAMFCAAGAFVINHALKKVVLRNLHAIKRQQLEDSYIDKSTHTVKQEIRQLALATKVDDQVQKIFTLAFILLAIYTWGSRLAIALLP